MQTVITPAPEMFVRKSTDFKMASFIIKAILERGHLARESV
jgi:hypothetical protein